MDINEKLLKIQQELKVPKGKLNKFGGYKYRTVDMILEKIKPLTAKYKAVLILHDDLELIGERYYVKATASLLDLESDKYIAVSALAREQLERKKSDESQLTGAASTYARKYALNGLFLLDDTADPDSYAGAPEDDDPEELDRQEAEDAKQQEEAEEKPKKRARSRRKKEESIEDYVNPPETEDGAEEVPFSEEDAKKPLEQDTYYFVEADQNYIMKHAGDLPLEGGKEITKEEFVKGSAEIATGKKRTRRRKERN